MNDGVVLESTYEEIEIDLERLCTRIFKRLHAAEEKGIRSVLIIISQEEALAVKYAIRSKNPYLRGAATWRYDPEAYQQPFYLFGHPVVASSLIGELSPWVV